MSEETTEEFLYSFYSAYKGRNGIKQQRLLFQGEKGKETTKKGEGSAERGCGHVWTKSWQRQDKHKTTRAKAYPSQDVSQPPEPASTCNRCSNAIGLYFTKSNFSVCSYFVIIFLMCLHLFLYLIQGAFTLVSRTFISWPLTSQWHHLLQFCTVRLTRFLDPVRRGRACNCVCHCSGKWW